MVFEMVSTVGGKRAIYHILPTGERVPIHPNLWTDEMRDFMEDEE